jgi:hypothetical protein
MTVGISINHLKGKLDIQKLDVDDFFQVAITTRAGMEQG